ncbi:hypothetical protein KSP40_PGU014236 [Platanthera guangdongensis]|uniref:Uncharacterized protein n=1 Tax=Platanthera guangdongensis TaxID=2320717 RepID=A0ABR2LEY4_9ASPA
MESLAAMCEAFVPSLSSQELKSSNGKEDLPTKGLQDFYLASGSQSPVPPGEASSIPLFSFGSAFF